MSGDTEATPVEDRRARVLAVDDHAQSLAVLRDVVSATGRLDLVGEAECGEQAVDLAWELKPDIVLMDVRMPGLGGIEAARRIKASLPWTVMVLVSATRPDELTVELDDSVVDAVIWKNELHPDWLDEIWRRHCAELPTRCQR
jgi:DNA-binding NarL/FixJ family response regulator